MILVTGGAGFIGSHLVDRLVGNKEEIVVLDSLSAGNRNFVNPAATLVVGDLLKTDFSEYLEGCEAIWHLAANPDVRSGEKDTRTHLEQNILATYGVLEAMRQNDVKTIYFTSTSAVYGEAKVMPTPEEYGPCMPISIYGASKLACEALIASYCGTFGMKAVVYRLANMVGARSTHGVTYDFINKLRKDGTKLEILGDGKQCKSYLHVSDCIEAMLTGAKKAKNPVEIFNIGSEDKITTKEIADVVAGQMKLKPNYSYTGGRHGWAGDVPVMLLSVEKMKKLGWTPKLDSKQAIERTARELLSQRP
jgi:UDP-glucose 4-epimerase